MIVFLIAKQSKEIKNKKIENKSSIHFFHSSAWPFFGNVFVKPSEIFVVFAVAHALRLRKQNFFQGFLNYELFLLLFGYLKMAK